jgi:hypothetical protein
VSTVYIRITHREAGELQRAPRLERLLTQSAAPTVAADWRRNAWRVIAGAAAPPSVAGVALAASGGAASGSWVCVASPVHLVAGMTNVTLSSAGVLRLEAAESTALAADFNRVFGDAGARLSVGRNALLLCVFDRVVAATTHDPLDVVGREVFESQPAGVDAPRLRRLMSEIELWLFEHAVNRERAARRQAAITGLWLWGGGAVLSMLPEAGGWTAGTDPFFAAFGDTPEFPRSAAATARGGVVVCDSMPGDPAWAEVERRWLEPVFAALRAGAVERVTVSAVDREVSVTGGIRLRFWRRPRPWWETLEWPAAAAKGNE